MLGTPVKVGIRWLYLLFGLVPGHVPCGGGPLSGSRWSARSAARTNDLDADEDPPHTVGRPGRGKDVVVQVKSSAASCETELGFTLRVPALSLIWVHGRGSGDMMIDGVPDVRAAEGCGRSFFPGRRPSTGVAAGLVRELAASIS